jgi:cellobiose phosphorylase
MFRLWSGRNGTISGRSLTDEAPLRAELYTADQMVQHGTSLAASHQISTSRGPERLRARLAANERTLLATCARLARDAGTPRLVTPAGEWLLDNFYLIEEEVRTANRHLPPGFSRELPRLRNGPNAALPRVYDLALEAVAHGDGRLSRGTLTRFVAAYQTVKPLQLGELWAIPIMLRLALIENLRRVAGGVGRSRDEQELAGGWADRMLEAVEKDPKGLILVVADMARSEPPMHAAFVAELARRLHGRGAALALPLSWVEQRLGEDHLTIEQLVQREAQHQAAAQVAVSNCIGSMRLLGSTDWREFVETLSIVDRTLRDDPADVYPRMDFTTRDSYRHVVEEVARMSTASEGDVARAAVDLAIDAGRSPEPGASHRAHVGWWLVDDGRKVLERRVATRPSAVQRSRRIFARRPLAWYVGVIAAGSVCLTAFGLLPPAGARGLRLETLASLGWWLLPVAFALLLASSQLAVALVNWLATIATPPRTLPRMDFSFGIPWMSRALVVVPTLLDSEAGIGRMVEALEVRFLANRDRHLHFGLLTDFRDAAAAELPEDAALLACARAGIESLNEKYRGGGEEERNGDPFFLFHRPRLWNAREGVWMGYERKRGKLGDLNALLRGGGEAAFSLIVGDTSQLAGVRYVITLDSDTQLPRESARQFVATMAHPLNRPRFGGPPDAPRVVGGYGILQPRVGVSLVAANRTRYARLFGGEPGIDPYTRAVSDVYQDLFREGSFIGKGIYDVDAFEHVLGGRLPENRILSHDLLEGCYARSGLLSDAELVEESPTRYDADVRRRHRWIRGDWQIAAWLLPRLRIDVRDPQHPERSRRVDCRNPISALSRWKILDNLRRSLAPAALLATFLLGWTVLEPPGWWTLAGIGVLLLPPVLAFLGDAARKPDELRLVQHLGVVVPTSGRALAQAALTLACLPYEAAYTLDAILRTLTRMWITHRLLLEWQPSAALERRSDRSAIGDLVDTVRRMAIGPALALATLAALAAYRPAALPSALPLLALWLLAPVLVWVTDRPLRRTGSVLNAAQADSLRGLARRTWAFFDAYVTREDNYLPPDNMQEHPVERVAHRTSPTNIGLSLLATLAAHDFGYVTTGRLVERTGATLDTMDRLEKHESHWFNWYDTQTLRPLHPAYVSSVDSGNLSGHLLTLRAGLLLLAGARPQLAPLFAGLRDTLGLLQEVAHDERPGGPMKRFADLLEPLALEAPQAPAPLHAAFETLLAAAREICAAMAAPPPPAGPGVRTRPVAQADGRGVDEADSWSRALVAQCEAALAEIVELAPEAPARFDAAWELSVVEGRAATLRELAARAGAMAEMDYDFLYDRGRQLLAIGYNVDDRRRDSGHYDLLASEVRLTTFVAIAQGRIPQESWFALGRQLATVDRRKVLLSWSGSMFEYLMPMLVMPSYEDTLLDETMRGAVERQIHYGRQRGVPWGNSESGYNLTDVHLNYQYRAFGVPGLGLKRGLAQDLVVAPYATVLAAMVDPASAVQNLQRLSAEGASGTYGYYEAVDYTVSRLPRGQSRAVVRSYMAHHQGMSLLALDYVLLRQPMQRRFASDPRLQAALLLLQERVPKAVAYHHVMAEGGEIRSGLPGEETPVRLVTTPDTASPEVQLLSNGRYHVMLTSAGAGYSRWKDLAVSRWHEDGTTDAWGSFCYLRDTETGTCWSTTHQPTQWRPDHYEAIFSEGRAEFRRRDQGIDAYTEVVVSPEDDIELRRLRLTNLSRNPRSIEVTSYAEIVLVPAPADAQHPAFSKLFVETEVLAEPAAILATRRARAPDERPPWMFHLIAVHGAASGAASHETDRARFIGRGRSLHAPAALRDAGPLSGSAGSVLDPIAATRRVITLEPEQTATIDVVWGAAETRDAAVGLIHKCVDRRLADRVFELAWTHSQVILRQLNVSEAQTRVYAQLANAIVYSQPTLRAEAHVLLGNRRGQAGLWGYAISGDLPIVLLQVGEAAQVDLVRQMVQAHAWWRLKGLAVDLVIWNEERDVYRQRLQEQIVGMIAGSIESHVVDRPGGIFVRHADQIAPEDRVLLQAVARIVITDRAGSLAEHAARRRGPERWPAPLVPVRPPEGRTESTLRAVTRKLLFFNGCGGFSPDGREYVVAPRPDHRPPAPWVNVIANPRFGTVVSEAGSAYTWCENAHELRLTPWHNDPVTDPSGEAVFLRDEETGQVWHPTSLPTTGDVRLEDDEAPPYVTRHGFGYSVFQHARAGIHSELTVFVAVDAAVKFSRLVLRNDGDRTRWLSATGYVEWVLGDLRAKTAAHIQTEVAIENGALYARNRYSNDFADWIGFYTVDESDRASATVTTDRTEFIGRNGSLRRPAAMRRAGLSGRVGAGLDPCAAIQVVLELEPGQTREITFRLGMGRSADEAGELVQRFRGAAAVRDELAAVRTQWDEVLGAVQVTTGDPAVDLLANGWLVYQTLGCRIWARSGYYQSGGAWGFRDQLQDAMALIHARPGVLREQLLLCASRQFAEGDVQHWWHPPSGRGVRTRISDDYLWLPLALARYLEATGDVRVLDEELPFLEGRPVPPSDESYYDLPMRAVESASLYEHAARALRHGLRFGPHGLPLIGAGDWNDGMNHVGNEGRGESVWLGFFLCEVLRRFAPVASRRGDDPFAQRCERERHELRARLEAVAWDGAWYRRAFFDDGTPLGSSTNPECRIDSIAQSWSVLSGVGSRARMREAMASVTTHLVRDRLGLVQLLEPPFDGRGKNPGYIAGYAPGVRENGGQYTHAAVWTAMAHAALGDAGEAWRVLGLINPLHHGRSADEVAVYAAEPYVVAADVYSVAPHAGRGGWSWYTGSAGWLYRLIVESLLGLRCVTDAAGTRLELAPCVPAGWPGHRIAYRHGASTYAIEVVVDEGGARAPTVELDGVLASGNGLPLVDDGRAHQVRIRTGPAGRSSALQAEPADVK